VLKDLLGNVQIGWQGSLKLNYWVADERVWFGIFLWFDGLWLDFRCSGELPTEKLHERTDDRWLASVIQLPDLR